MNILGISCYYHDSAASLVVDGKVVASAAEERFSRIKHDSGFPELAVKFCLEENNLVVSEIDWVVFYEKPFLKFERISLNSFATAPMARGLFVDSYKAWLKDKLWVKSRISKKTGVSVKRILFSSHHTSHAAATYYTSGFDSAAIITCDGVGEWTTTAWGVGTRNKIRMEKEIKYPHSLGLLYSVFTQYLGFRINNGEFKVMGLSPYGEPKYVEKIRKVVNQSTDGSYKLDLSYFNFHKSKEVSYNQKLVDLLGVKPNLSGKSDKVVKAYADIALSVQKVLEESLLVIAKHVRKASGEENLCYGGGVALNGVANWKIFKEAGFKNIHIHPAAGDDGAALGAALYVYKHVLARRGAVKIDNHYLGAGVGDVGEFLAKNNIKAVKLTNKELIMDVSKMLAKGKVVGWVRGRFEWGPRALGSRSILADPRSKKMKNVLNKKIKFRESFRPFAPVVLYEFGKEYFEIGEDSDQQILQYMLAVVSVKEKWREKLGAVTHVDGTARPQLIKRNQNPVYYDLVKSFGKLTGVNCLVNTSFNLKGDPIVGNCDEAYKTFMNSGIDVLVLENYLIVKD